MSVRTGMYHFEVSRTAMYRVRYVLVRTSTYSHVLPCTRCTGFQMTGRLFPFFGQHSSSGTPVFSICLVYTTYIIPYICSPHQYTWNIRGIFMYIPCISNVADIHGISNIWILANLRHRRFDLRHHIIPM